MANIITENKPNGSSFFVGNYIDKGSFSKVYTLQCCSTSEQFAGKFISKEKLQRYGIYDKVWSEIKIHQLLRHPNIVHFLTYIEQEQDIVIVLEYCSKYSMVHVLYALKKLTLSEAKYFMEQIISAIQYLHRKHVVHRDLKLGNLFVNKDLILKLGDFGLAVKIEYEGQKRFSRCGTPNYLAPEVIKGVGHSYEVDVWALGCILHTMLEGTPPFQGENTTSTYNNILKCKYCFSPGADYTAKAFIMSCLQPDPVQRPSVSQLLQFEFLTSTEIIAEAPKFSFGEDEVLSFYKKRLRLSHPHLNEDFALLEPMEKDHPQYYFQKLFIILRHVKKWPDSNFGEFLSEHNSIIPLVWVNSWMDYSNSYGFAYLLSNDNYGIVFNDNTRMLFQRHEETIHYCQSDKSVYVCQKESIPQPLHKKAKILMVCQSHMEESLVKAHEAKVTERLEKNLNSPAEVFKWVKGDTGMIMFLTNGSVQVNFTTDHTKLILCGFTRTVTIIESAKYMKTLKLDKLQHCGCSRALKGKLGFALKHIYNFLADKDT